VGAALLALEQAGGQVKAWSLPSASPTGAWASEQRNLLTNELDLRSTFEIVGLMHLEDQQAIAAMEPTLPVIAQVVDEVAIRMRKGGRLIYIGAGTSGRLGVLDASECPPTFSTPPEQVIGVMAGGPKALTDALEGVEDEPEAGRVAMKALKLGAEDTVVGIAASGRTPYVKGALAEAQAHGALTVALVCNLPTPFAAHADFVIAPLVGPEVLTGSTRLKAGTAQKLVLNMLSTATMVRLGKSYGNLMVDVQSSNLKLQARAVRIVAQACNLPEAEAQAILAQNGGEVKTAIISHLADCSAEAARHYLAEARGGVRAALQLASAADNP
jgi:N-acetylmuramic acid 6-phosphate etherase